MPAFSRHLRHLRSELGLAFVLWRMRHTTRLVRDRHAPALALGFIGRPEPVAITARQYLGRQHLADLSIRSRLRPLGLAAFARHTARAHGLCAIAPDAAPASLREDLLLIENHVSCAIPLPASLDAYRASLPTTLRYKLRKALRDDLRLETTRDPAWIEEFLTRHHHPTMRRRHGDNGYAASAEQTARILASPGGEFLRILQGDRILAAATGEQIATEYRLHQIGWLDGSDELLTRNISVALHWFAIRHAHQLGIRLFNSGGTPSDLENGLFNFKNQWGASIYPPGRLHSTRHLLLDPAHPRAHAWLAAQSQLIRSDPDHFLVLSGKTPAEVPACPANAPFISAWFQLRPSPAPSAEIPPACLALPRPLRPWFNPVPLPWV